MECFARHFAAKVSRTATNCFKITNFTAIKWFTDASGVVSDSKAYAPMSGSLAPSELALQVSDVGWVDWPVIFGL